MEVVIRNLHEAVKEIEPTEEEWFEAIQFLTRTGQICTEWRQEFILLSDVLGVSMLVDAINNRKPSGATEKHGARPVPRGGCAGTADGRQHLPRPARASRWSSAAACLDADGHSRSPAPMLDVWQANDEGFYDVQQKGMQPDFNLRGVFRTGRGRQLLVPRRQAALLSDPRRRPGRQAAARARPAPLPPGASAFHRRPRTAIETLTTHIFDPDDPYIHSDAVFGVKQSLLAEFVKVDDPARAKALEFAGPFWEVAYDFVLAPAKRTAT